MKTLIPSLLAISLFSACSKPGGNSQPPDANVENGAQFKAGRGVFVTEEMKTAIGLKVAEVGEESITPSFTIALHVIHSAGGFQNVSFAPTSSEASGWLTEKEAALVKPGMKLNVRLEANNLIEKATVQRVEKVPYATLGDFEVGVTLETPMNAGQRVLATFRASEAETATAIPQSALLKTAEGTFVYAVNDGFYVRTPVTVGVANKDYVSITDGLYAGDSVVVSPVTSLWLAELQVLRGGKACTCGH